MNWWYNGSWLSQVAFSAHGKHGKGYGRLKQEIRRLHTTFNHFPLVRLWLGSTSCKGGWEINSWAADGTGENNYCGLRGKLWDTINLCPTSQTVAQIYCKHYFLVYSEVSRSNPISLPFLVILVFGRTFAFPFILYLFHTVLFRLCKAL